MKLFVFACMLVASGFVLAVVQLTDAVEGRIEERRQTVALMREIVEPPRIAPDEPPLAHGPSVWAVQNSDISSMSDDGNYTADTTPSGDTRWIATTPPGFFVFEIVDIYGATHRWEALVVIFRSTHVEILGVKTL